MSHLVALLANDPERLECALAPARAALSSQTAGDSNGWGLGFVQGGDVLLQKRPRAESSEVDFYSLARGLPADALVALAGLSEEARMSADNADPFRFRSWLFASIGDSDGFDQVRDRLLESVPDFLRRNIRGRSASEHIFHLFLAFLHDAGLLETSSANPDAVTRALSESVAFVDRMLTSAGMASSRIALVATNGRCLVARANGRSVRYLEIHGILDCPVCRERQQVAGSDRRVSHEGLRAVIVEADASVKGRSGWTQIPENGCLLVGHDRVPRVVA